MSMSRAEYIWLDGGHPTQQLRSKMRVLNFSAKEPTLADFPVWGFDGSSTNQASGHDSDLVLDPVCFVTDPLRGEGNYLVMCEVLNSDMTPHKTNARARLRRLINDGADKLQTWIGFEQEYTLLENGRPLGWPEYGFPAPQGPYYCGVGNGHVYGRQIIEEHADACLDAGIMIYGTNAEVMPGQWEYQIGYRGLETESADPLTVSDHLWLARWLMERIAEDYNTSVSLHPKPIKGDWNGAGAHTNISTLETRDKSKGWATIQSFIKTLSERHEEHIRVYGEGLSQRLTGEHETCNISTFKMGERDRGASIRIPDSVSKSKCGYVEDRRPGANCDPYKVAYVLLEALVLSRKQTTSSTHAQGATA